VALAEHSVNVGHCIQYHDTSILAKKYGHMEYINEETIQTELHPNNMNREEGFSLSGSWKLLIKTLKQ
jgi:hypothetical protein